MMGGLLGLVGLGRVRGSQKTTPRDARSLVLVPDRMDDCDTPVDGALSINEAADGVAVCKMGLLICGLAWGTRGRVDDLGSGLGPPLDRLEGKVVVLVSGMMLSSLISDRGFSGSEGLSCWPLLMIKVSLWLPLTKPSFERKAVTAPLLELCERAVAAPAATVVGCLLSSFCMGFSTTEVGFSSKVFKDLETGSVVR